jgi:hypothetical protein
MGAAALGGSGREAEDGVRRAAARIWARERAATAGGGFSSRWLRRRRHGARSSGHLDWQHSGHLRGGRETRVDEWTTTCSDSMAKLEL